MPAKKSTTKKNTKRRSRSKLKIVRAYGLPEDFTLSPNGFDDVTGQFPYPMRRNPPPSPEAEAKRLARRKALTLKAARIAYENHHQRKTS